jgi:Kef-type K+ transport system membrane component KefB
MSWVTVVATLVLMGLLHLLARAGPVEARATLALGFLFVAAQLGGDLAKRARLPVVTGFLLTGFALGPAWLGLIRDDEVRALQFIGDAALAVIGFTAGSQLTFTSLRRQAGPLVRVTAGTVLFPLAIVALVVLTVSPWFPLTVHQPVGDALAVALVLGTIAAASSPAVSIAVMDELDARGPVARAVLDVSVAKDVAAVVLFALVLVVVRPLASPGAVEIGVAGAALVRLGGAVVVGAGLGAVLARYGRLAEQDTRLLLVALALCLAGVARALVLEPLFVGLAAGCAARQLWRGPGVGSLALLQRGALPVYLVFFALAGAAFGREDLAFLIGAWPWVALLAGLRAVALRYGALWAARSPDVMPALAQGGWLGLISQAGVALGLAAAARRAFPEWGVSLEAMIVALVGVHETLGPLCFRRALRLTGEVTEAEHVTDVVEAGEPGVGLGGGGVH